MLRSCLGSQTCAAAPWLLLRLEASAKSRALQHRWSIDDDTYSRGRLSALDRRLDVVHWAVDLAAGHREPQHHVGKRDPIWSALSGAVPSDVLADNRLPYHLCFLSAWAAPVLSTWAAPVLDMGGARTGHGRRPYGRWSLALARTQLTCNSTKSEEPWRRAPHGTRVFELRWVHVMRS